jgi:hypothetical protein
VETYNGSIWVESQLGRGSTFRFTVNGQFVVRGNSAGAEAGSGSGSGSASPAPAAPPVLLPPRPVTEEPPPREHGKAA